MSWLPEKREWMKQQLVSSVVLRMQRDASGTTYEVQVHVLMQDHSEQVHVVWRAHVQAGQHTRRLVEKMKYTENLQRLAARAAVAIPMKPEWRRYSAPWAAHAYVDGKQVCNTQHGKYMGFSGEVTAPPLVELAPTGLPYGKVCCWCRHILDAQGT